MIECPSPRAAAVVATALVACTWACAAHEDLAIDPAPATTVIARDTSACEFFEPSVSVFDPSVRVPVEAALCIGRKHGMIGVRDVALRMFDDAPGPPRCVVRSRIESTFGPPDCRSDTTSLTTLCGGHSAWWQIHGAFDDGQFHTMVVCANEQVLWLARPRAPQAIGCG